jgi:hypothetical protein
MTNETNRPFDILVTDGVPAGKLTNVGTAWPTAKGAGYRFTLKVGLPAGAQVLILPSRSPGRKPEAPESVEYYSSAQGTIALVER